MDWNKNIDASLRDFPWKRVFYSLYAIVLVLVCVLDRISPLDQLRFPIAGALFFAPLCHLSFIIFRGLLFWPSYSLFLPFLYWGWVYVVGLAMGQAGLASGASMFDTLWIGALGYFATGIFVSPGIILLEIISVIGVIAAKYSDMSTRRNRSIVGAVLAAHVVAIVFICSIGLALKT